MVQTFQKKEAKFPGKYTQYSVTMGSDNCGDPLHCWLAPLLPIMVMMMTTTIMDESLNLSYSLSSGGKADYLLNFFLFLPARNEMSSENGFWRLLGFINILATERIVKYVIHTFGSSFSYALACFLFDKVSGLPEKSLLVFRLLSNETWWDTIDH